MTFCIIESYKEVKKHDVCSPDAVPTNSLREMDPMCNARYKRILCTFLTNVRMSDDANRLI